MTKSDALSRLGANLKTLLLGSALLLFAFSTSQAEIEDPSTFRPGELLVQVFEETKLDQLEDEFSAWELKPTRLLSRRMHIWLFEYKSEGMKAAGHSELRSAVANHEYVNVAQFNHYVTERQNIPNDPSFGNQWDKHNTGQSGGTPDADIDAPEAWDLAIGDTTLHGDEVVVAIIDGGSDVDHPDLPIFINENEIPSNGIDDDGNGYIDDWRGWDVYGNDGNVPDHSHGAHCAGIAAASGNNGIGIAGVNWNVKVLAIAGSSTQEATVVAAYSYVHEMRSTYNETDGEYGAFIVSTNASFGVDYGNPDNYPLWCGMYDSLGHIGVLSCGATANININIDNTGDVPTACPSDYMIAVTNTTNTDAKNSGAAYGLTTIDLGAPGTQIYSTVTGGNYSYLTGTSMATPQVTGAIGLMYSLMCNSLMEKVRTNPDSVALLVKQYILEGTDPNSSLNGKTVSGGRLNIYNSALLVIAHPCGANIAHDGLQDTRDTLNSREVSCSITSDTTLIASELLLHHRINSGSWSNDLLVEGIDPGIYLAVIPPQSPGTFIEYFMTALDDNGVADTTTMFEYSVISYGLELSPEADGGAAGVGDIVWYDLSVSNTGLLDDEYYLSVSGNGWDTEIYDASGMTPITSSGNLAWTESFDFKVRVTVPVSNYGDIDEADITAESASDLSYQATVVVHTSSFGQPLSSPVTDSFPDPGFNSGIWIQVSNATIDSRGIDEPSEPYSLNLNGNPSGGDEVASQLIHMSGQAGAKLSYWYQRTGGGDSPEVDDDLFVEYLDSTGSWQELNRHLGSGSDMLTYEYVELLLPGDALHDGFRLRFRNVASGGPFDDWFIDDVFLGAPYTCGDINNDGSGPDVTDLTYLVDFLFAGGSAPPVMAAADVDGSGDINVSDLTYLVDYLFAGGLPPEC